MSPNRLIDEKSPYLKQHASNPVDWYPWGGEAFREASTRDSPIFLSIGYSTCHWCHVMERESFEDDEIARLMNETFVCVKVDREERPDIDSIYMDVCQLMTGGGGWPLTIIMTPDRRPFFAATYIPNRSRFGSIGMRELIPKISHMWSEERHRLEEAASESKRILLRYHESAKVGPAPTLMECNRAFDALLLEFDAERGGFGKAPKFPMSHRLLFLLNHRNRDDRLQALNMVRVTLDSIANGGIHDIVGGGFHRYSTDRDWRLPHFEKMLYDQAMLGLAYTEASLVLGDRRYRRIAERTLDYVLRDMTSENGGFFSAEDAESGGEEGRFYLWTSDEILDILEEPDLFMRIFNIRKDGNISEMTRDDTALNVLYMSDDLEAIASGGGMDPQELERYIDSSFSRLMEYRARRERPSRDDKILADWNGLMIAALARASWILGNERYLRAGERAMSFILDEMTDGEGRLYHCHIGGENTQQGLMNDYSCVVWGLLELYSSSFSTCHLIRAKELMKLAIEDFWDGKKGGFFQSRPSDDLIVQKKELYDGSLPSANSISMMNMLKLSRYTGEGQFEEMSHTLSRLYSPYLERPQGYAFFLMGLELALSDQIDVVIVGENGSPTSKAMLDELRGSGLPGLIIMLKRTEEDLKEIAPFTQDMRMLDGQATAYICRNRLCSSPVSSSEEFMDALRSIQ